MAARRLLIIMLVLLGMSTLAAALAPVNPDSEDTSTTTRTDRTERGERTDGQLVERTIDVRAKRPKTIRVPLGDQVSLRVRSKRFGRVEIRGLGLFEDVAPLSPARFNVLAEEEGRHEIRLLGQKRELGALEFTKPERKRGDDAKK
jgi:hypothetical protein